MTSEVDVRRRLLVFLLRPFPRLHSKVKQWPIPWSSFNVIASRYRLGLGKVGQSLCLCSRGSRSLWHGKAASYSISNRQRLLIDGWPMPTESTGPWPTHYVLTRLFLLSGCWSKWLEDCGVWRSNVVEVMLSSYFSLLWRASCELTLRPPRWTVLIRHTICVSWCHLHFMLSLID